MGRKKYRYKYGTLITAMKYNKNNSEGRIVCSSCCFSSPFSFSFVYWFLGRFQRTYHWHWSLISPRSPRMDKSRLERGRGHRQVSLAVAMMHHICFPLDREEHSLSLSRAGSVPVQFEHRETIARMLDWRQRESPVRSWCRDHAWMQIVRYLEENEPCWSLPSSTRVSITGSVKNFQVGGFTVDFDLFSVEILNEQRSSCLLNPIEEEMNECKTSRESNFPIIHDGKFPFDFHRGNKGDILVQ